MNCRKISPEEIAALESQGCSSSDWSTVEVADGFSTENIRNARITACFIGSNVTIRNVSGELRNLNIYEGSVIEAVYSITCNPDTTFCFGYRAEVMSETGGRSVALTESLTAQTAYIQAFYRHSALLSKKMEEMVEAETEAHRSSRAPIGPDARIVNCGTITDCWIAGKSVVEGASKLTRGFVDTAYVGADVIAEDFIVKERGKVTDGAHLKGVFVGECATVSAASVHDSLIFANCQVENGEVAASFLGPFTTTMHKSTLLIGGLFSFFNAGSGSNQSNHAYKLGPMHQGITQRGCKTGSDSYILWPAAIGAFTTILGRHYGHPDTRDFPFSILLNDHEGCSVLLPGAAAATVGFARDVDKWPRRDRREEEIPRAVFYFDDITNFQWLSPFTVEACLRALRHLREGRQSCDGRQGPGAGAPRPRECQGKGAAASPPPTVSESVGDCQGFSIPEKAIEKGVKIYKLLITRYIAETLLTKIQSMISVNPHYGVEEIIGSMNFVGTEEGHGHWVDLAGLLAPKKKVEKVIRELVNGEYEDLDLLATEGLHNLYENYNGLNWSWFQANLAALLDNTCGGEAPPPPATDAPLQCSCSPVKDNSSCSSCSPVKITMSSATVAEMLERGAEAIEEMTRMWEADAAKEFDPERASLGFGIDAYENRQEILDDFARARGSLAGNKFLAMNQRITKDKAARMRMFAQVMRKEG